MTAESAHNDLHNLSCTNINAPIPESLLTKALTEPPFIPIPGILNLRDLGALPNSPIRRNLLYRSGALMNLTVPSITSLKDELGIKMILDLRSERECARLPTPVIEGMRILHYESLKVPNAVDMERFVEDSGRTGYVEIYGEVLEIHKPSIQAALEWIRDEGTPMLFHCTGMSLVQCLSSWSILMRPTLAGKDRTGVLAAILLALAGASNDLIALDYALTRVGIEPAREMLTEMLRMWNQEWSAETPGMTEFSSVRGEFITATLGMMESKYGGVEGYVKGLGFGDEDLKRMRGVLRGA